MLTVSSALMAVTERMITTDVARRKPVEPLIRNFGDIMRILVSASITYKKFLKITLA